MGAIYTVQFNGVAVTAQQDLFEVVAPSAQRVLLHCLELSQTTEFGDAQEEDLLILIKRGQTTTGSGGGSYTAVPTDPLSAAAGSTCKINNTTKATAGTIVTVRPDAWNVRNGYIWLPPPELRITVGGGVRATVELATTPADSITMNGCLWLEEL